MRKKLCLLFVLIFIFSSVVPNSVFASNVMPRNNNTLSTNTIFTIFDDGDAAVAMHLEGYPGITTGATISIKIEKRNLLVFWKDIVEETIIVNDYYYFDELHYQLEKTGTYRCTVTYTVYGTGGEADVITSELTDTYK